MELEKKSNDNLFLALSQHIKDPFIVMDLDWNILSFNKAATDFLPISGDKESFFTFIDEESVDELKKTVNKKNPVASPVNSSLVINSRQGEEIVQRQLRRTCQARSGRKGQGRPRAPRGRSGTSAGSAGATGIDSNFLPAADCARARA